MKCQITRNCFKETTQTNKQHVTQKLCTFNLQMLQQQPGMIINYALSCVGFHIHQLKINGSGTDPQFMLPGQRARKREKEWARQRAASEGGWFFTWACHHGVQLIIIITVSLSPDLILPSVSLSSIMAVLSSSSNLLLLLLISSLDWLSTPGSAFLIGRDHVTSSGRCFYHFVSGRLSRRKDKFILRVY